MHEGFTVFSFLKRAITLSSNVEIVQSNHRQTYRETYERVIGLSNSLLSLGISKGTVIGVADYNTHKYVELLYASSLIGAIIYPNQYTITTRANSLYYKTRWSRMDVFVKRFYGTF